MIYTSKPNELIKTDDGREFWISRAPAVNTFVIAKYKGKHYLLMDQRGENTPDWAGYWNTPCGYLDWDETLAQAALREIHEETGVDLINVMQTTLTLGTSFKSYARIDKKADQPYYVDDTPNRSQNITHHFFHYFKISDKQSLPPLTNQFNEPGETMDMRWVELEYVFDKDVAFGQLNVLRMLLGDLEIDYKI